VGIAQADDSIFVGISAKVAHENNHYNAEIVPSPYPFRQ